MATKLALSLVFIVVLSASAFAQAPAAAQQRVVESVVINGQTVQGVLVVQNGAVQTYTCPSPQVYVTADRSESGWACFESSTGMWLLHAQPPQQSTYTYPEAPVYSAPPTMVYNYPTVPYYASPYSYYPYGYYPYAYYPYVGRGFGFGFGFGFGHVSRAPVFVNRGAVIHSRPFIAGRPGIVASRPFVGSRAFGGRFAGGRMGRR